MKLYCIACKLLGLFIVLKVFDCMYILYCIWLKLLSGVLIWILFFAKTGKFQVQSGGENFPQYGPGPGAWGAYDMQRAQGHR